MKIATWNVNSVNVRLPNILKYLKEYQPDILCLQELKCSEDKYPLNEFVSAGYHSVKWNARNYLGDPVGAGVYFYQVQTNNFTKTKKMVLIK